MWRSEYVNRFFKLFIGLLFILTLTGCFGEKYDFTPPTVSLVNPDDITQEEKLAEANIDWALDKKYNKKTKGILSLAKKQNTMYFNSGQRVQFNLENGEFYAKKVKISLWQIKT